MYGQKGGLEAAVAAATKLDASLHAKGKLTKNLSEGLSKSDVLKLIQAEFSINHVPLSTRNLLCKGSTQEIIKDFSGACVSTKGRYIPENERKNLNTQDKSAKNLGLYLFIQGPTNRSVDLAIQKIEEMIASNAETINSRTVGNSGIIPNSVAGSIANTTGRPSVGNNLPPALMSRTIHLPPPVMEPASGKFIEKIRIGLDNVLPGFNLPMKLIGQGGSNLNYIKNETGATVTLRGIGSAFLEPGTQQEAPEPLHFCITHHKPELIASARDLALNLIATVQQEYAQFQMQQPPPQTIPTQVQQINVEPPPNVMLHQPGNGEHPLIQQPIPSVMSTSIALPVVQTGFIQQPAVTQLTAPPPVVGVPPPHFSQPPPAQVALPPPGVHIPQQQGPLVPPPAPQHVQIQPQHEQPSNFIQQIAQPFQTSQQNGQQQYVITQNGQPMQGIMTSQGLVVLNQQTQPTYAQQQVFLSQPPPVGPTQPVFQSGQPLAFQSPAASQQIHAAVSAPVSYQFQYVQQNPPPTMTYSAVQNPIQAQQHLQIQPPQQHPIPPSQVGPPASSGQSPVQSQQTPQPNPNVSQPPPSLPNHTPGIQNPPPNQRHSPNIQAPPPNHPNPPFSGQPQNQMLVQQIHNPQMIQNAQPVPLHNQNIQTIPASTANFIPGQPQIMQIQGIRPPTEIQTQFQIPQQNYGQYPQQQVVMKQIQVCQPQQLQFVPGCPPGPIQILPATSGQLIPPVQQLPPAQYNQNQDTSQDPKPPKRKFTEEISATTQQAQTPPQSLMSIPMQPPQPVPPPSQTVANNNSARQGVGVQELMIMNQQQRRQHLQQAEGIQKDSSQKGEEASVLPPPTSSTGNQQNFPVPDTSAHDGDKGNHQRQFSGFEENSCNREGRHDSDVDDRNNGYRRDRTSSLGAMMAGKTFENISQNSTRRIPKPAKSPSKTRERPTFSHYSSKPQMYDNISQHPIIGIGMCPPPPPPPPHMMNQPQASAQQSPANHFYQNNRPY